MIKMKVTEKKKYPPEFEKGVELYGKGYYWRAHEIWEELWHTSGEPERSLLKALIQISAALIHSEKSHWDGVLRLLTRAEKYLSTCPNTVLGISIPDLLTSVRNFQSEVQAMAKGQKSHFDGKVKPRIAPVGMPLPKRERFRRAPDDYRRPEK
ncbi:MAG: DUF309 domain-containing protein [bacterium JZ-2024 1]